MKGTKLEEQVQNINENIRNYETKRFFPFRETTRNTFSYFAKRSKLGETVTCLVQFRISRNLKKIRNCQP